MSIYDPIAEALGVSPINFSPNYSEHDEVEWVPSPMTGLKHSDETKLLIGESSKLIWSDPEYKAKHSPMHSARGQKMFNELWKDEDWKAKKIESIKEDWQRPEYKEAQIERVREQITERWKDPDYKKKVSNSLSVAGKNKWADPEYRIYMITKMAEARERKKGRHS